MSLKKLALASAIASLLASSPAHAGWRDLPWNTPISKAKSLYPSAQEGDVDGMKVLRLSNYEFAGFKWPTVSFVFAGGKLTKVVLFSNADPRPIIATLQSQLGSPARTSQIGVSETVFRDPAKKNTVVVQSGYVGTLVTYQPLGEGF